MPRNWSRLYTAALQISYSGIQSDLRFGKGVHIQRRHQKLRLLTRVSYFKRSSIWQTSRAYRFNLATDCCCRSAGTLRGLFKPEIFFVYRI
jgi:hypothetical protein